MREGALMPGLRTLEIILCETLITLVRLTPNCEFWTKNPQTGEQLEKREVVKF